jgi:hypothetical protein
MCWHAHRREDLWPAEREALELDELLVCTAKSLGAFDLAVGVVLARMFERDLVGQLSYASEVDYLRERLLVSPSLGFSWARLARELRHRPVLRQAVATGLVSPAKALAVLPLAVGDHEAQWTEAATRLSLREIAGAVRAAGKESPEERFEVEVAVLPMTPGQQARLDAALSLAKEDLGPAAKRWQCLEAICQEFLAEWEAPAGPSPEGARGPAPPLPPRAARIVARHLAAVAEALHVIRGILDECLGDDALSLDACARRLLAARRRHDETFGILAARARADRIHQVLGLGSFDAYCAERLGMGAGTVRRHIWLEGRMKDLPELREAFSSGRLPFTKAAIVARHATPFDVGERIARARATTVQQLERESQAEEDRKGRDRGVRKLWSPADAMATVRDAIAAAQAKALAERGAAIDEGEALASVADHFVEVWEAHLPPDDLRARTSPFRRIALMRKGGLCSVPGCSRAAVHVHHITFRSRGGKDVPENGVALCAFHHLRGVHAGTLEVTGRAGERLCWRFGNEELVPAEEWITYGDDDVCRADFAAAFEAARAAADPPDPTDRNAEPPGAARPTDEFAEPPAAASTDGFVEPAASASTDGFVEPAAAPRPTGEFVEPAPPADRIAEPPAPAWSAGSPAAPAPPQNPAEGGATFLAGCAATGRPWILTCDAPRRPRRTRKRRSRRMEVAAVG